MRLDRALVFWVGLAYRRAWWVLVATVIATPAAGLYAIRNLGVQTDIAEMFSPDLPFRRADSAYRARFLHEMDTLLVVVDGQAPELIADAGRRLAERLASETDLIEEAYRPRGSRFLEEHALLYLDLHELEDLADRLAEAQPLLGRLSRDCTLGGFCEVLTDAFEADGAEGGDDHLQTVLRHTREAVDATLEGRLYRLSWQELIDGEPSTVEQRRDVIVVRPRLDYGSFLASGRTIERIRQAGRDLNIDAAHGLRLRVTGAVALRHEELATMRRGAGVATTLAVLLVIGVLVVGLRSIRLTAASLAALFTGLIWTAAFATFTVGHVNLISVAFGVLYIGLGIDFAIHLCLRYQELLAAGEPRDEAVVTAAGDVGVSVLVCALTTAIAFFAFVPTPFRGVSELGLIAGSGMIVSLVVTVTVLPAMLAVIGAPRRVTSVRTVPQLVGLPVRYAMSIRVIAAVVAIATLPLLSRVWFDSDPLHLRDPNSESVSTLEELLEHGAASPWHVVALVDDGDALADLKQRFATLDAVDQVVAYDDFVPDDQAEKLVVVEDLALVLGPDAWSTGPKRPIETGAQLAALRALRDALDGPTGRAPELEATARTLGGSITALLDRVDRLDDAARRELLGRLDAALLASLPATLRQLDSAMRAGPVRRDDLPEELTRQWLSDDGVYRVAVFPSRPMTDSTALREFVTTARRVTPDATGAPVFHVAAADAVIRSFRQALLTALITVIVVLMVVLRSVRDTTLVLVPVLLAGLLLGAAAVVARIPFNFANVIAVPLLLGMGVDGGIHMVLRRRGVTTQSDVLATSTSRAVFYSALTTIAGFGALALSSHPGMASLGKLLTLGMLFVLLGTLVVLPALLHRSSASR